MTTHYEWECLYALDKNGKVKEWKARAESVSLADEATAIITFGQRGGKMQEARRTYTVGKNLGKKNETSPWQQCVHETDRKWRDKLEKEGYSTREPLGIEDEKEEKKAKDQKEDILLPMLAHTFDPIGNEKKRNPIRFPCYVQPKIDGLRCLIYFSPERGMVAQSRTGGIFTSVDHLLQSLQPLLSRHPDWVLDGELYTRDYPFEELAGLIKKTKRTALDHQKLAHVQYHVYDAVHRLDLTLSFATRWHWVRACFQSNPTPSVVLVETKVADHLDAFRAAFSTYISDGWEGVMLRNGNGVYTPNYRSNDLQKYKEFIEEEFPIVGWKEGEGRDEGTVIWECKTKEGVLFSVRPRGTLEMRREWFQQAESYLHRALTVVFQEWSEKRVPRFPVGKAIREDY